MCFSTTITYMFCGHNVEKPIAYCVGCSQFKPRHPISKLEDLITGKCPQCNPPGPNDPEPQQNITKKPVEIKATRLPNPSPGRGSSNENQQHASRSDILDFGVGRPAYDYCHGYAYASYVSPYTSYPSPLRSSYDYHGSFAPNYDPGSHAPSYGHGPFISQGYGLHQDQSFSYWPVPGFGPIKEEEDEDAEEHDSGDRTPTAKSKPVICKCTPPGKYASRKPQPGDREPNPKCRCFNLRFSRSGAAPTFTP